MLNVKTLQTAVEVLVKRVPPECEISIDENRQRVAFRKKDDGALVAWIQKGPADLVPRNLETLSVNR